VSLKRKLVAGGAALLVAGGGAGAGLAASGHGTDVRRPTHAPPFQATHAGFLRASAWYLGLDPATLRKEVKSGRTIADIADATPGRSSRQLTAYLVRAASTKLAAFTDRPLTPAQQRTFHAWLERRVTGFVTDTCPLGIARLRKQLGGCPGMAKSFAN
jgi:hypothetical protein